MGIDPIPTRERAEMRSPATQDMLLRIGICQGPQCLEDHYEAQAEDRVI